MQKRWENYQRASEYAIDIAFEDACDAVEQLVDSFIKMEIDDEVNF